MERQKAPLRIAFIGKSHEFSLAPLRALLERHQVVAIIESAPRGSTPSRSSRILGWLKNRLKGLPSLSGLARRVGAAYLFLEKDRKDELAHLLSRTTPDLLCVASLSQLLPSEILRIPKHGAINVHPSLLPKYPGPFPWFWQYLNFEREIGVTIHRIDEGEDTGAILKQEPFTVDVGLDIERAMAISAPIGARLMAEAIAEIETGQARPRDQEKGEYPRARVVKREERLIEWTTWPLERVWHAMRGTYPWMDATDYPDKIRGKVRVGEAERGPCDTAPGLVGRDSKGWFVAHPEGRIRLLVPSRIVTGIRRLFRVH